MTSGDPSEGCTRAAPFRQVLENPAVYQRIVEYLGAPDLANATCLFLASLDPLDPPHFRRHPPAALRELLDGNCEFARSLEDRDAMLVHLDIEYVNFDDAAAAYLDPQRIFQLQEPLVRVIESRLLTLGIRYLHLVTGQGHHFVWKIRKNSPVAGAIRDLDIVREPDPLFAHVALLMEYLAHQVKPAAAAACRIPVEITAVHVGYGVFRAREMLSIDISEYGDPLSSRAIRIPYTVYRKPWESGLIDRLGIASQVPGFFTLPLHEMSVRELIDCRHLAATIIDLAQRASVEIPLEEDGTRRLLEAYRSSGLIRFHREFHEAVPSGNSRARAFPANLPPCARHVLSFPNDLLLKPSGIRLVTRCLLADGWRPHNIAAAVASVFEDPSHHWGHCWRDYDPGMRAQFYVRLFAGQIDQGIERGMDFNCVSQQEKSFCWNPANCSLEPWAARLYGGR